mgnify:CR=1 FL=1
MPKAVMNEKEYQHYIIEYTRDGSLCIYGINNFCGGGLWLILSHCVGNQILVRQKF